MGRLDHPQSQRARHDLEGRLPIDGRREPAEPVYDPPVDREEPLALRRQEGIQASHLKRPWPLLLQLRRDARLARTARAVQDDACCCHSARMPHHRLHVDPAAAPALTGTQPGTGQEATARPRHERCKTSRAYQGSSEAAPSSLTWHKGTVSAPKGTATRGCEWV